MPQTTAKRSQSQVLKEKSKKDNLFSRLMTLYDPSPLPPLSLPMFQDAQVPVLLFPTLQIAQARVWRNHEVPDSERLKALINEICRTGLAMGDQEEEDSRFRKAKEIGFVIALCETLFRPLLAVELHLERLFPGFLYLSGSYWPPSPTAVDQLAADFRQRWKEQERTYGREWILPAGGVHLKLRHRPALIAPWVVGATVKRWLNLKGTSEEEAIKLASGLTALLFGREVRAEEFHHWAVLIEKIVILTDSGNVSLPGYLLKKTSSVKFSFALEQTTPASLLEVFPIDKAACDQFATILQQAWSRPDLFPSKNKTGRRQRASEATSSPEQESKLLSSACLRCNAVVSLESVYEHLESAHGIDRAMVEAFPNRRELRLLMTREALFRWEES